MFVFFTLFTVHTHQTASDMRDRIEIVHTEQYGAFLQHVFPVIKMLLTEKLQPQSVNNTVNKVRAQLWDILNRLPHDATLQPYATQLVRLAMQMVQLENEDNAIICVRTIFDLHKLCEESAVHNLAECVCMRALDCNCFNPARFSAVNAI
eukprot:10526-Heterococcus_DN1.PRE.1